MFLFCEDRLRQLGLFHLELRGLWADLTAAFHYLKGACKKTGETLFISTCRDRTKVIDRYEEEILYFRVVMYWFHPQKCSVPGWMQL